MIILWNSIKFACEKCLTGHRNSSCAHINGSLLEIKGKGRPVTQCLHCRSARHGAAVATSQEQQQQQSQEELGTAVTQPENSESSRASNSCCSRNIVNDAGCCSSSNSQVTTIDNHNKHAHVSSTLSDTSRRIFSTPTNSHAPSQEPPTCCSGGIVNANEISGKHKSPEMAVEISSSSMSHKNSKSSHAITNNNSKSHHHKCRCGGEPPKDHKTVVKVFFEQESIQVSSKQRKRKSSAPSQLTLSFEPSSDHLSRLESAITSKTALELIVSIRKTVKQDRSKQHSSTTHPTITAIENGDDDNAHVSAKRRLVSAVASQPQEEKSQTIDGNDRIPEEFVNDSSSKKTSYQETTYSVFKIPIRLETREESTGVDVSAFLASNPCRCHFGGPCICAEIGASHHRRRHQNKRQTSLEPAMSITSSESASYADTNELGETESLLASALVSLHYQGGTAPVSSHDATHSWPDNITAIPQSHNRHYPSKDEKSDDCGCGCSSSFITSGSCCFNSISAEPSSRKQCCTHSFKRQQEGNVSSSDVKLPPLSEVIRSANLAQNDYCRTDPSYQGTAPRIPPIRVQSDVSTSHESMIRDCGCHSQGCCVNKQDSPANKCSCSTDYTSSSLGKRLCCC